MSDNFNFYKSLKITYSEVIDFVNSLDKNIFSIESAGKSFLGRDIFLLKAGKGQNKILLWSQMHGNEPVSTKGLLKLLFFLQKKSVLAKKILDNCTIWSIPMLNPDGAENYTRRNAQQIDINRDALKLTSPEAKILHSTALKFQPDFAFNLHDQDRYYGIKTSDFPTTISFLSPSFDFERSIDQNRETAMKLIASVNSKLHKEFKNIVTARYNDAFMPSAFGDFMQTQGFKTLLFEAGYIPEDENRQKVTEIYFNALVFALESIVNQEINNFKLKDYLNIEENIKFYFTDIILKNLEIEKQGKKYTVDISLRRKNFDKEQFTDLINNYVIDDIGDLSKQKAFEYIDCSGISINDDHDKIRRLNDAGFLLEITEHT